MKKAILTVLIFLTGTINYCFSATFDPIKGDLKFSIWSDKVSNCKIFTKFVNITIPEYVNYEGKFFSGQGDITVEPPNKSDVFIGLQMYSPQPEVFSYHPIVDKRKCKVDQKINILDICDDDDDLSYPVYARFWSGKNNLANLMQYIDLISDDNWEVTFYDSETCVIEGINGNPFIVRLDGGGSSMPHNNPVFHITRK